MLSIEVKGEGWSVAQGELGTGEATIPVTWLASFPLADEDVNLLGRRQATHPGLPIRTLERLPEGGVVVAATGPRAYAGRREFPQLRLPLRIANGWWKPRGLGTHEDNVSVVMIDRSTGDHLLNVAVWLGAKEPAASHIARADEALASLHLQ